jgi:hypothetical protein
MIEDRVPAPHDGQLKLLNLRRRYRVAVCGRRFGKTVAAGIAAVKRCHDSGTAQRIWWISPIQSQSDRVERDMAYWLSGYMKSKKTETSDASDNKPKPAKAKSEQQNKEDRWSHRKSEHALIYSNGSRIEFHSAHNPNNLRGAGLDLAIIDEAADVSEDTWKLVIRPMLLESCGEAFIIGTPRGKNNWLHRIFLLGQAADPDRIYGSIQLPTSANPLIDVKEIDAYRNEMIDGEYRQEFEAEFIDGVDSPFPKMEECISGEPLRCGRPGESYVTGIDLGRSVDYTVLVSIGVGSRRVEGFDRFNKMDWSAQLLRMHDHLRRFPGACIVDATGVGDPIYEQLARTHRRIQPFCFTAGSKERIIQALAIAFSNHTIALSNIPVLLNELRAFTKTENARASRLRSASYGAPPGMHDDCVTALALAWYALEYLHAGLLPAGNPFIDGMFA